MKNATKYNKSEIFRNAWSFVKKGMYTLSVALRQSWMIAKKEANKVVKDLQELKKDIMYISYIKPYDTCNDYQMEVFGYEANDMVEAVLAKAVEAGNDFIKAVSESILKFKSASEKQAYCLARFATEQGMKF